MKTKADARNLFLRYLDEATKKGIDVPLTKNADYRDKFDYLLDTAQKYIAGIIKIPEVYTFSQSPIPSILGLFNGFELKQILEPYTDTLTGCKAIYLEVDNICTVEIKVNAVTVETISNTVKNKFTAHKVLTGASSTDAVTITYSSDYVFNVRNRGYYAYNFPSVDDIPAYTPYVSYDMPSDFMEFDSVIIKSDPRVYQSYIAHKWENNKKIIINYYDKGSFDIHYYKYPSDIAFDADDTTPLEIEEKAFDLVPLQCAILATASDNPALSSWLRSIYIEKASNITQTEQPIMNSVQTVFAIN